MGDYMTCPGCMRDQFKFNRDRCLKEFKWNLWNKKMIEANIAILENTPTKNEKIMCPVHWAQFEKYVSADGTKMEIPVDPNLNVNEAMQEVSEKREIEMDEEKKELEKKFREKFGDSM